MVSDGEGVPRGAGREPRDDRRRRGGAFQISPAFTITETGIDTMVDGFEAALRDVAAG